MTIYPPRLTVNPPLYLLTGQAECYKCELIQPVIGLAAGSVSDPATDGRPTPGSAVLTYVTDLPASVLEVMAERSDLYRMRYSVAAGFDYYMNLCTCGATFGDHYLAEQPGGPFMPLYDGDADTLTVDALPFTDPLQIGASSGPCTPDLVELLAVAGA